MTREADVRKVMEWVDAGAERHHRHAGSVSDIALAWLAAHPEPGETVRVRIAVGVDGAGDYCASGWSLHKEQVGDESMKAVAADGLDDGDIHWSFVEADVPLPRPATVEGRVSHAE